MRIDLYEELKRARGIRQSSEVAHDGRQELAVVNDTDNVAEAVRRIQVQLVERHGDLFQRSLFDGNARERLIKVIEQLIRDQEEDASAYRLLLLKEAVIEQIVGLGPLEHLLQDPDITEIMVNAPGEIFVERHGRIESVHQRLFSRDREVRQLAQRIVARIGRQLNTEHPMVDARLGDGSRVNLVIPPISQQTIITIRKPNQQIVAWDQMIRYGSINEDMVAFLGNAVRGRVNMVVAGGAGAGKTTLMRQLCRFIPDHERIITIEDIDELRLQHANLVRMEAQKDRDENPLTIYDLLVNALRMRPDRIIIGEIRGNEAIEFLDAAGTGHPGSMTTIHAESPETTIPRMARMMMKSGYPIPYDEIVKQIQETIELIVYVRRMPDGSRKVTQITEVAPDGELRPLYSCRWRVVDRELHWEFHKVHDPSERLVTKCEENGVALTSFREGDS